MTDTSDPLLTPLLEAAAVVFRRDGYAKTRMQDIAVEAGLSTGAIYNRFRGKAELFAALLRPLAAEDIDTSLTDARASGKLDELLASFNETLQHGRPVDLDALTAQALSGARSEPEAVRTALDRLAQSQRNHEAAIGAGQAEGIYPDHIDTEALASLLSLVRLGAAILHELDSPIRTDAAFTAVGQLLRTTQPPEQPHSPT